MTLSVFEGRFLQTLIVPSSIQMTNNPQRGRGRAHMTNYLLNSQFWTFENCDTAGRSCLTAFNNEAYTAGLYL